MLARLLAMENRFARRRRFQFHGRAPPLAAGRAALGPAQLLDGRHTKTLPGALWLLYLQTGRPEIFIAAQRNLRHVLGMDLCNDSTPALAALADPRRRKIAGAFGDDKTPVHWQSTCCVSDRHARLLGPLLAYYLSGDPASPATPRSSGRRRRRTTGLPPAGADGMAYLDNLVELLSLSYDPALVERAGDCADYLFRMPEDPQETGQWIPGLRAYLRATGDARAAAYLQGLGATLKAAPAQELRSIGLLRDLHAATGDAGFMGQAPKLVENLEKRVRQQPRERRRGPAVLLGRFLRLRLRRGASRPRRPRPPRRRRSSLWPSPVIPHSRRSWNLP